ncbi:hypothetical protein H6G36_12220 [Anabaena minutissima FACHB-250]|nr:hypothetical protein [Anabaena minutissima FACHB-250]
MYHHNEEDDVTNWGKDYTPGEKPLGTNWFGEGIKMLIGVCLGVVITVAGGILLAVTLNNNNNDPDSKS